MDGKRERGMPRWAQLAGIALTVTVGLLLLLPLGDGLARLSYDLPFPLLSPQRPPEEVVMVFVDNKVKVNLGEPSDAPLNRRYYVPLLERAARDGAKLVLLDLLFDQPCPDPAADTALAAAMRLHGRVLLVQESVQSFQANTLSEGVIPPCLPLAEAAAAIGLANIHYDPDFAVRALDPGTETNPTAGWLAADILGATVTKSPGERLRPRWLNYYCGPERLLSVNLDHAIQPDGLPAGFLRGKIVVVGGRQATETFIPNRDAFANPFFRFGGPSSPGATVHAFTALNLLRGDWLTRPAPMAEAALVIAWGIALTSLLMRVRPWPAIGLALLAGGAFGLGAAWLQLRHLVWTAWLIPAAVQTPIALIWSVAAQYQLEFLRRARLRRAFGAYLSPYMAERIANSDFELALGGKEVEATVMFTDLEGFTQMSEGLPPAEVSRILTSYFSRTTRAILDRDGTIIKYVGDAVMAVWGAPLAEPRHADRALAAAWELSGVGRQEIAGRQLRTRIGINSGLVLAGNLGSEFRFDYTLIGDTTNFASRLEELNKYLGTEILIAGNTRQRLTTGFALRHLGRFVVAGKKQSADVYELLGPEATATPTWARQFEAAVDHFGRGHFDIAEHCLQECLRLKGSDDGPVRFYRNEMAKARANGGPGPAWDGTIVLDRK